MRRNASAALLAVAAHSRTLHQPAKPSQRGPVVVHHQDHRPVRYQGGDIAQRFEFVIIE
ncbi:hypothetical protein [Pseudomonas nitroreducens]|uniref:hypothetical protein n=1 Tax=Pseudomonas nitroreducens TaxID=46680 RepID=UPI003CC8318C